VVRGGGRIQAVRRYLIASPQRLLYQDALITNAHVEYPQLSKLQTANQLHGLQAWIIVCSNFLKTKSQWLMAYFLLLPFAAPSTLL
jgi:hypothetical protein